MTHAFRLIAQSGKLFAFVVFAACASGSGSGGGSGGAAASQGPAFAPSLGINLASMKQTATGMYYQDLEPGSGAPAIVGDFVRLQYSLYLTDGRKIDGTEAGQPPFEFRLGQRQVITGWEEGVTGMRAGGKRRIVVPPRLGYGMRPYNSIPGNSTLVFDLHVVYVGR